MGKFAGFLKRLKKVVNYGTKGIKWVKNKWNTFITRPGVGLLNTIIPGSQLITDALFKLDDKVNQGLDWIIDKTNENSKKPSINPEYYRNDPDIIPGHRPIQIIPSQPSQPIQPIKPSIDRTYFNFNK